MKVTEQVEGKAKASKQFELCVIPDVWAGPNPSRSSITLYFSRGRCWAVNAGTQLTILKRYSIMDDNVSDQGIAQQLIIAWYAI